jgi:hypothetical protein
MITFNLEQPLIQKDVEEKVNLEKQKISAMYARMLNWGIAIFVVGAITMYFYGIGFHEMNAPNGLKLTIYTLWLCVTGILIMLPLMFKPRILELLSSPYTQASLDRLHDCKAFISMPGMEKHKEYVENVRKQGRELTYFECDEIIKYWRSLSYK